MPVLKVTNKNSLRELMVSQRLCVPFGLLVSLGQILALRLTLWNEQMEEEKKTEKSNNKTHKKIEHGGENSYHALCCVFEVLEDYRKGRG